MLSAQNYSNSFFSIKTSSSKTDLVIEMSVSSPLLYSSSLPATLPILRRFLPSIFKSKCFNTSYLPFLKEAEDTEVGHLFEHIFLEYLADLRINTKSPVRIKAYTEWDWYLHPKGTFHIVINSENIDSNDIDLAAQKSCALLELIYIQSTLKPVLETKPLQVLPLLNP